MDQENNSKEQCVKYVVGDLLWAKIGSHPYWPCMVSYDPYEGCCYKMKKVRSSETPIYHVQYFGKQTQHGWTSPGLILPFEGELAYRATKRQLMKEANSDTAARKIKEKFEVPPGTLEKWVFAVREAEAVMDLEVQERFESCVFKYDINLKKFKLNKGNGKRSSSDEDLNAPKKVKSALGHDQKLCEICKKGNIELSCSGVCLQHFHKDCLGLINTPVNFCCVYCERGLSTCFICKRAGTSAFKCKKCKYHYHEECLEKFACSDVEKKKCSYHTCLTCYNENPRTVPKKGPYIYCVQCPTIFHANVRCIPVGSVKLSPSAIICPEHFLGKNKISPQVTSNVLYCSVCFKGGKLICCESCPKSYHTRCIDTEEIPIGDFFCEHCINREYLYVGMIVWAKTGNFRGDGTSSSLRENAVAIDHFDDEASLPWFILWGWWPAQIVDVDNLPANVKNMTNYDGEFPVQYFGTDEYFWTHRGRVVPYAAHHKQYSRSGSKQCRLDFYFKLSLDEAAGAYDEYVYQRQRQISDDQRNAYKHIKVNRAIPPAQIPTLKGKSVLPCSCNPGKPFPCGSMSDCLNRSTEMECHPDVCLAGDRCQNMRFQKRSYANVEVFKTENRGWGLRSEQFIAKEAFVIEYVGEVITHEEYRKRVVQMREKNEQNYYFLYLDSRRMIDAGPQGNDSRFINHSCAANCRMTKWSVNGDLRIGIFAIRDIHDGEELTFNYQFDNIEFEQKCYCGSASCQGIIGKKPKSK